MYEEQNEFTVTLLSNASYDIYPQNNVFNFSTVLAKPLNFNLEEDWRVCLQSISLTNISDDPQFDKERTFIVKKTKEFRTILKKAKKAVRDGESLKNISALKTIYSQAKEVLKARVKLFNNTNSVFVRCEEINPLFENDRNISAFVIPPILKKEGEFMFYEPTTEEYFNITTPILEKISIQILNPKGLKIYRTVAQPSIVVLKFKKMQGLRKSYTINITNTDNQNPADFFIKFPYLPIKDGENNPWEIAVTRVSLLSCFKKFPPGKIPITVIKHTDDYGKKFTCQTWETYIAEKPQGIALFECEESPSHFTLVDAIRDAFENACSAIGVIGSLKKYNKTLSFEISSRNEYEQYFLIILPEELIYVLGFDNDGITFKNGFGAIPTRAKKKIIAKRQVNTNFLIPQNLLLYSDCVVPSLVGNVYGQYLTNIPIPRTTSDPIEIPYTMYEPKNLEFHPLQRNQIEDVRVRLLKTDGTQPQFIVDNIKIYISLLIREAIV